MEDGGLELRDVKAIGTGNEGKLHITGISERWFIRDFSSWSDGTKLILSIDKIVVPPISILADGHLSHINGLPENDPRPFFCFGEGAGPDSRAEYAKVSAEIEQWSLDHRRGYKEFARLEKETVSGRSHRQLNLGIKNPTAARKEELRKFVEEARTPSQ